MAKSTRTVSINWKFQLSADGREMRQATLEALISDQLHDFVERMNEKGYKVSSVKKAGWESIRSDGRGFIGGDLTD